MDIAKFCKEFQRLPDDTCANRTNGIPIPHCMMGLDLDLGCHTAIPYGVITFEQYILAAKSVAPTKNIVILTDDGKWARKQSKTYRKDLNILVFSAPSNHRGPSNFNGANVFASFELAQQCHGFIGHLGSAFSHLIFRYMCFHHHMGGKSVFGKCPDLFDFSMLSARAT